MPLIRYIGAKERKEDNVAGTGIIWLGNGDEQNVTDPRAVAQLLRYPLVWELDGEAPAGTPAPVVSAPPPAPVNMGLLDVQGLDDDDGQVHSAPGAVPPMPGAAAAAPRASAGGRRAAATTATK